jgi:hypothetical protein
MTAPVGQAHHGKHCNFLRARRTGFYHGSKLPGYGPYNGRGVACCSHCFHAARGPWLCSTPTIKGRSRTGRGENARVC